MCVPFNNIFHQKQHLNLQQYKYLRCGSSMYTRMTRNAMIVMRIQIWWTIVLLGVICSKHIGAVISCPPECICLSQTQVTTMVDYSRNIEAFLIILTLGVATPQPRGFSANKMKKMYVLVEFQIEHSIVL